MAHTDENGRSVLARSTVAKRMRGALKGHKNVARRAETKSITKSAVKNAEKIKSMFPGLSRPWQGKIGRKSRYSSAKYKNR